MEKLKFSKSSSSFYEIIKHRVRLELERRGVTGGPDVIFWLKGLVWFIVCWGTYFLVLQGFIRGVFIVPAALVISVTGLLLGFSIGHDASHRVLSRSPWVNKALHYISFLTVGIDPLLWGLRHVRSHHLYPNVEGSDIDIDKNPLLRLSPTHPWKPIHRYQHIYAPCAYALALVHSIFWGDWIYLFHSEYRWMRRGVNRIELVASFVMFKLMHFFVMIILPWMVLDFSLLEIVTLYLLCGGITSLVFIVMLVGTHFFSEACYFSTPVNGVLGHTWAEHNLQTSCDWNPESRFARFISGGANCHAAHHLFPNICHTHYGFITKIIEEVSVVYHVTYYKMSLSRMILSHFKHLQWMGQKGDT